MSELNEAEATVLMAAGMYASPPTEAQMKDGIERAESWLAAHDREVKAEALREVADKVNAGRNSHWLIEAADSWAGYYSGVRAGMEAGESALRDTADRIDSETRP